MAKAISRTGWNLKGFLRFACVLIGTSGSCDIVHDVGLVIPCREGDIKVATSAAVQLDQSSDI